MEQPYFEIEDSLTSTLTNQVYEILSFEKFVPKHDCFQMRVRLHRRYYDKAISAGKTVPMTVTLMYENEFEEYRLGHYTDETRRKAQREERGVELKNSAKVLLLRNKYLN